MAGQPDTFLTDLGPEVLTTIYRLLPQTQHGYGCVALAGAAVLPESDLASSSNSVLGFVAATSGIGSLFVEMGAKHLAGLAPPLLKRFVRRPDLLWRSMQTAIYPFLVRQPAAHAPSVEHAQLLANQTETAELLSIMVLPEQRSRGIGSLLLHTLVEITRLRGLKTIHVTVDAHNLGAQRFYLRHGFGRIRTFSLYGRPMCLYQRRLL